MHASQTKQRRKAFSVLDGDTFLVPNGNYLTNNETLAFESATPFNPPSQSDHPADVRAII